MRKKIITLFLLSFTFCSSFYAQDVPISINLSDIEVSAQMQKLYSGQSRILTIIDKAEINYASVQTIDQLLEYIAGLDIRQRGAGGVQADISIRGGSFDQVLVLLNGVNITDPQTGHYNLDIPIDLSDVARIEILQGSAARVLGINAFSGAINIITEEPNKNQLSSLVTIGSFNTYTQNTAASFSSKNTNAFASLSHQQSDGYRENTDYNLTNAFVHTTTQTKKAGKFGFQGALQQKSFGANGFYSLAYPNQFDHTKTFFSAITWSFRKGQWNTDAQIYWRQHHDRFELFRNHENAPSWYTSHNYHQTDVTGGKIITSHLSRAGKFTFGIDLRNEHIYSNVLGHEIGTARRVPFTKDQVFTHQAQRLLSTAFIDYAKTFNDFYLSAGGVVNYTHDFGALYFGGVDLSYQFNKHLKAFTTFNSAVRLPTFTDLYYRSATQISNPNLQAEKSKTIEAGIKYQQQKWSVNACIFYRQGYNIIDWVKQPDSTRWESRNLTNVNAYGSDIAFNYSFDNPVIKKLGAVYSFLQLDKKAENFDSKYALDYLRHKLIISLHHNVWNKLSISWQASFMDRAGDYIDFETAEKKSYDPYFLLDARIIWADKNFDVYADINNILNTRYTDYGGLPLPGIYCNAGVRLRLN